jgi:hypothetical protein
MLAITMLGVGFMASESQAGDSDLMMEMLNAVGKGLDNNAKMNDCIGGNYQANWSRCTTESQQRTNQQIQQFQRRDAERTQRNAEKRAVEACEEEQDPGAFERCVREQMR